MAQIKHWCDVSELTNYQLDIKKCIVNFICCKKFNKSMFYYFKEKTMYGNINNFLKRQ